MWYRTKCIAITGSLHTPEMKKTICSDAMTPPNKHNFPLSWLVLVGSYVSMCLSYGDDWSEVWLQNIGNILKGAEPAPLDIFNNTLPKLNSNWEPQAISAVIHRQKSKPWDYPSYFLFLCTCSHPSRVTHSKANVKQSLLFRLTGLQIKLVKNTLLQQLLMGEVIQLEWMLQPMVCKGRNKAKMMSNLVPLFT